ncbi:MAG: hypothetical protein HY660_12745 [Armatimonadetes bacterium]|nr:hypothetical protein [Armatimonadota bacterium]
MCASTRVEPLSRDARLDAIRRAYRIAVRDLRACYNPDGVVAGRLHFNAYWARDSFWALFGVLALGDYDQARAHLDLFIRHQLPSGQLPVRVEFVGHTFGGYHTRLARPKVLYRAGGIFRDPVDPAALFIVAAREYFRHTGDMAFCDRFDAVMDRAVRWLIAQDRDGDGLIENRHLADWMDSILKKDKLFNLNVLFYEGLRACEDIKRSLGQTADADMFRQAADRAYARIHGEFWTCEYFTDWIRGRRRGGFSADGNVLAMLFGVATEEQSRRIMAYITTQGLDARTPLRTCHPVYPLRQVFPFYVLAGIPDYHRTLLWPWLGTLNAVNKARLGDREAAVVDLARIGEWFLRENAVAEVYTAEGRPVARRFYHAEVPFAWNAGLYVYAVHALGLEGDRPG